MITTFHVDMLALNHNHIEWSVDDGDPSSLTITVSYGENQDNLEHLVDATASDGYYDHYHNMGYHRNRVLFYKLTLKNADGSIIDESTIKTANYTDTDEQMILVVQRIRDYWNVLTNPLTVAWVFKKRTWGPRCYYCTDEVYGKSSGNCDKCYDTGIIGGYFAPIKIKCAISPLMDTTGTKFELSPETITVKLGYYPLLNIDDLCVIYMEGRKQLHKVAQVTRTGLAGMITSQTANMIRMPMSCIEYRLLEQTT